MASGWNLWMWLECIGVVSGCCCKEVYRCPHNNYYFSVLHLYYIALFLTARDIPTSLFILKMFFVLVYVIFVQYNYSKRCSKNTRDRSKIEIMLIYN